MPLRKDDIPDQYAFKQLYDHDKEWINPGESVIVDPDGAIVTGSPRHTEEILLAEVDPVRASGTRWILDVTGHYGRPHILTFRINTASHPLVQMDDLSSSEVHPNRFTLSSRHQGRKG